MRVNLVNLPRIRPHQVTGHLSRGEPASKVIPSRLEQRPQRHTLLRKGFDFGFVLYSKLVKPVAVPPGLARFATKPAATGSFTERNTIGTVGAARCTAAAC